MTHQEFEARVLAEMQLMYRLASSILRNEVDREDAVQSCVLRAWEKLPTLRDESKFRPWLMRILANCCRAILRKRKNEVLVDAPPFDPPAPPPNTELRFALEELPEKDRLVIVLHYLEGMPLSDVAFILHASVPAVKSRLSRARASLKRILNEDMEEEDAEIRFERCL